MLDGFWTLVILQITASLVSVGVGWPLWAGRIPPNGAYGIRSPRTMADEQLWYRANALAGRLMVQTGLAGLLLAASIFLFGLHPVIPLSITTVLLLSGVSCAALWARRAEGPGAEPGRVEQGEPETREASTERARAAQARRGVATERAPEAR